MLDASCRFFIVRSDQFFPSGQSSWRKQNLVLTDDVSSALTVNHLAHIRLCAIDCRQAAKIVARREIPVVKELT
jgi:hypothetical protein